MKSFMETIWESFSFTWVDNFGRDYTLMQLLRQWYDYRNAAMYEQVDNYRFTHPGSQEAYARDASNHPQNAGGE